MATHNSTSTSTSTVSPQQAAQARLLAAMAAQGAGGAGTINLAKLQPGRAYTLKEVVSAVGFQPRKRSNGKPVYGPLRRELARAVAAGKLVTATTGGYQTANGTTAGGKAYYMLVD